MEEVLRTSFAPGGDGVDAWGEALGRWLAPVQVTPRVTHPAEATLTVTHFGYLSLLAAEAGPMRLSRTARLISGPEAPASRTAGRRYAAVGPLTSADAVAVVLQEAGDGALTQDGRSTALRAGDTAVVDLRRPFCLEQRSSFRALLLRVPEHALGIPADRLERVTARVAAPGGAGLLASYLSGLAAAVVQLPRGPATCWPVPRSSSSRPWPTNSPGTTTGTAGPPATASCPGSAATSTTTSGTRTSPRTG